MTAKELFVAHLEPIFYNAALRSRNWNLRLASLKLKIDSSSFFCLSIYSLL